MHTNSLMLFERFVLPLIADGNSVLEVGPCRRKSYYRELAEGKGRSFEYHFTDLANHNRKQPGFVRAKSEYSYRAPDDAFDMVLSGQVIEHVRKPWLWVRELARMAKSGGYVAIIAPITTVYHPAPVDCWRIFPEGMKSLFEEANLQPHTIAMHGLDEGPNSGKLQVGGVQCVDVVAIGAKP